MEPNGKFSSLAVSVHFSFSFRSASSASNWFAFLRAPSAPFSPSNYYLITPLCKLVPFFFLTGYGFQTAPLLLSFSPHLFASSSYPEKCLDVVTSHYRSKWIGPVKISIMLQFSHSGVLAFPQRIKSTEFISLAFTHFTGNVPTSPVSYIWIGPLL